MNELSVPVNPSTIFAHNLYLKMRKERVEKKSKFKSEYKCMRCRHEHINTFYNSKDMYHIQQYRQKKYARVKCWEHFCRKHGEFYLDNNNVPEERIIRPEE